MRLKAVFIFLFVAGKTAMAANAPSSVVGVYPESALIHTEKEEQEEAKRLDDAKEAAQRYAQEYEQNKEDTEREIRAKRRRIEDLKIAQESLQKDQEFLKAELADLQKKNQAVQKRYQDVLAKHNKEADNRDGLRKDIEKTRAELKQSEMSMKALENEVTPPKVSPVATADDLRQPSRWTFLRDCVARPAPEESAKPVGKFQKSKFVFGKKAGEYVKVIAGSGAPLFVKKDCVKESVSR